jgi:hypothetical protein
MMRAFLGNGSLSLFAPWLFLYSTPLTFAQGTGTTLTFGTVTTGQCYQRTAPGCVLPNLFGPTGLTLFNNPNFTHYAHFIGSAQTTLNQTLGTAIATQLTILPIISPASGFTYKYDRDAGAFVRSTTTFGPIYTERAETIGRGNVYVGASYQRFRFKTLDGIDLKNVPAVFSHVPDTGPGGVVEPYEKDVITSTNNIAFKMDQIMLFGTVGITDRIDVSLAIPLVSTRMEASSYDTIQRLSGPTTTLVPSGVTIPNPHEFNASGALTDSFSARGSAFGIGDIIIRAKGTLIQREAFRVALAMDVRVPSGDARQLLGSGSTGIRPFLAISAGKRVSPHVNLGYQWNSRSILAGNLTGATVFEGANGQEAIQNGPATKGHVPSNIFYSVGTDIGVTNRLTLAFDYLGQTVFNAPRVYETTYPGTPFATIAGRKNTMPVNNGAAGLKFNIFGGLLLTADVLFRMDNNGLRQDVTPLVGLSRAFGK